MLLLRKCCCFDLRTGCFVTAMVRLVSWVIVLTASVYTCLHVFSPDDRGMFHYRVILNIEKNAYVLFLAILASLIGLVLEPLMMYGVSTLNPAYIRAWMTMTVFSWIFSMIIALCFILHNAHVIRIGDNWFNDALCVLADVVFFFIPEYLLGPRLIPLLIAILILAHLLLPVFHGYSFLVVYSYYRWNICPSQEVLAAARAGNTHSSAPPLDDVDGMVKAREGQGSRLCHKCQHAQVGNGENGLGPDRCTSTPLLKPIETTC